MPRDAATPVSVTEARILFADLARAKALVLAVSGGPDSTALMVLAGRWRKAMKRGPDLVAVTVDHGLRPESRREARSVARLAATLGIAHRTLRWTGTKPKTGIPEAAREARYRLLARAARNAGARYILTAHTLDDQAETVVMRLARGSGMSGLVAMQRTARLPGRDAGALRPDDDVLLLRPLLQIPKLRLIATLQKAKIAFADDPTNRDAAFTRARLRGLMPALAAEGLDARRLSVLARRLRRADEAVEAATDRAIEDIILPQASAMTCFDAGRYFALPSELALRALGRAISAAGSDGRIELAKLEALQEALAQAAGDAGQSASRWRRTLAGALVTLQKGRITVETAPARRTSPGRRAEMP